MIGTRADCARLRKVLHRAISGITPNLNRRLPPAALCERLETRTLLAANDPIISEFMADNTTGLVDANNKHGDWIEIYNPAATPIDMQGWHLTDQASNLSQYTFPSYVIPAGGYKVVFATGEVTPYVDSLGYPHTNFKLNASGDYLALVKPDGVTKTTEFNPFPKQSSNISYGVGPGGSVSTTPVPVNANAKVLVPTNSSVDSTWQNTGFNDSSWTSGQTGVGYENNPGDAINYTSLIKTSVGAQMGQTIFTAYIRIPFSIPDPQNYTSLTLRMKYDDGFVAYLNGQRVASANAPATLSNTSFASAQHADTDAINFQDFDLTPYLSSLVAGNNVLAIDGLNVKNSSDFVILPELDATKLSTTALQYFGTPSPGAANIPGSVLINEIHYNPDVKTDLVEFIELYNSAASPLDISGWKLGGGIAYNFPSGTSIPANGYLLIAQNPTAFQTKFGKTALGPYTGSLSNNGDSVKLLTPDSAVIDEVHYGAGFPWPTVGDPLGADGTGPSIQLINAGADNDLGASWRSALPTPGAPNNSVLVANPPPAIRQVSNSPSSPTSGQPVTITAKVSDTDGLGVVNLLYQVNAPGAYIPSMLVNTSNFTASHNPAYDQGWITLPMYDDGTHGDATPGDGIYSAQIPGSVNQNRTLIRYKVSAIDTQGASVTVPYADDPSLNFAYYVYDGVPGWSGAIDPGSSNPALSAVVNYSAADMNILPVYQIIARNQDVIDAQHIPPSTAPAYSGSSELWRCTLVYNGVVYDNIGFRVRGGSAWRYAMGKNKWEFNFNRNDPFQAYDNYGRPYAVKWDNFDLNAIIDQGNYWQRGEQGMFEGINNALWNLVGVPANDTAYMQLRVVDDAAESTSNQYNGDLWGMYMATDANDGNFLAQHDLPDGNYYRMNPEDGGAGGGTLNNQGATQPSDNSDLVSFTNTYKSGTQTEQWWEANLNLDEYYSYRTIVEAVHHYDIDQSAGKNYFYYHNPVTGLWEVHPWDSDLTWANNMYGGGDEPFKSRVLPLPDFNIAYKDRIREIRDLLFNTDQAYNLIDEYANMIDPIGVANSPVDWDRAMWDYNPIMDPATGYTYSDKGGVGRYYAGNPSSGITIPAPGGFRGMVQEMKNYVVTRAAVLDGLAADSLIPNKPTLTYLGPADHAIDKLTFKSSNFSSPGNNSTFASMEWRIGETYDPSNPIYASGPRPYEITANWESPELTTFGSTMSIPSGSLEAGHTYRVRVRMKDANGRWSDWSAPIQFVAGAAASSIVTDLRVSEIMYNPAPPPPASPYSADDFEYVELINKGTSNLDLSGVSFSQGIAFTFPNNFTLAPGQRALVVKNASAFRSRYGNAFNSMIAGTYTKSLSDSGDHILLQGPIGQTIMDFSYNNTWYPQTDGQGFSLVIIDPNQSTALWGDKSGWRASTNPNGDPGQDIAGLATNAVVVNEVMANPQTPNQTWVEIKNATAAPIDLSHWFLSDDSADLQKYQLPDNSIVAANGYLVLDELSSYGVGANAFSLSRLGGTIYLSQADATSTLQGYREAQSYDASDRGVAEGQYTKSTGKQDFTPLFSPTPGATNAAPVIGPIVISEIMYDPAPGGNEFIELRNITNADVDVSGWTFDGISFTFASGSVIPAHAYALIVPIDPGVFRSSYNVPAVTQVFGPFFGLLDDAGENIRLTKPGTPAGAITPYIPVDNVNYSPSAPWPAASGVSLSRFNQFAYGNDVANWLASPTGGTPGKPNVAPVPTGIYDLTSAFPKITVTFTEDVSATLTNGDLTLENLSGGTVPSTTMTWDPTTLSATWTFNQIPADANYRATLHADHVYDWAGNQLNGDGDALPAGDYTKDFFYLAGDANQDRTVGFADLVAVAQHYGATGGQTFATGDFNGDGNVSFADLVGVAQHYGITLPAPAAATPAADPELAAPVASTSLPGAPPKPPAATGSATIPPLKATAPTKAVAPSGSAVAALAAPIIQEVPLPPAADKKQSLTKPALPEAQLAPRPAAKPARFSKARIR